MAENEITDEEFAKLDPWDRIERITHCADGESRTLVRDLTSRVLAYTPEVSHEENRELHTVRHLLAIILGKCDTAPEPAVEQAPGQAVEHCERCGTKLVGASPCPCATVAMYCRKCGKRRWQASPTEVQIVCECPF